MRIMSTRSHISGLLAPICALMVVAATAQTAPALAEDSDSVRFDAKGFLKKFDNFVSQSEARQKLANRPGDIDVTLDFSFNGEGPEKEPGFLYLKTPSSSAATDNYRLNNESVTRFTPNAGALPRSGDVLITPGETSFVTSFTPRVADAHLQLHYETASDQTGEGRSRPLDIALSSRLQVRPVDVIGSVSNPLMSAAFDRRAYDVGLNVGYWGFNLGASLRREVGGLTDGYEGYDVGLSYSGARWSTSLAVGEYRRDFTSIVSGTNLLDDEFYALEFGASYRIGPRLRLTGGLRWFEYGRNFGIDPSAAPPRSQLFYLGTKLNF